MSSFDNSASVFLRMKHGFETFCVDFLYFCGECRQQRAALHFWQMLRQRSSIAFLFIYYVFAGFFMLISFLVKRNSLSRQT